MATVPNPVGGNESPQWDKRIFDAKPARSSIKIPYFRIQIGTRTDSLGESIRQKGILANKEFQAHIGTNIERFVTKINVVETMDGPERYTIELVDPDMAIMFSEHLYIGKNLFLDIGYWQGSQFLWKNAAEGPINTMEYKFPENGLPRLIIKGFGLVWDILNKESIPFHIIFDKTQAALKASQGPLNQRAYRDIPHMLQEVATKFELKIIPGKTVPEDLMDYINPGVMKQKNLNPNKQMTWNGYLQFLAAQTGCKFFQKGRYLHFFPPAWINAPVKRRDDMTRSISELQSEKQRLEREDPTNPTIKQYTMLIKGKQEELKTWDVQMNNTSNAGIYELNYMMGTRNMLSFNPVLTDINTAGYLAMAMDPETGEISFGSSMVTGNDAGKTNCMKVIGKANPEANTDMSYQVKDMVVKKGDVGEEMFLNPFGDVLNKRDLANSVLNKKNIEPKGPMDNQQAAAAAQASFLNWMWFAEAKATCIGDPYITCAMPVWVRGLGPRTNDKDKTTREFDSGKLCGKWYVFEVIHEITPDKEYICELNLKRFWNYLNDFDTSKDVVKDTALTETDKKLWIPEQIKSPTQGLGTSTYEVNVSSSGGYGSNTTARGFPPLRK